MLDIMDGKFVNSKSLNFDFKLSSLFEFEAHLMVENPSQYVDRLIDHIDWVILHIETLNEPEKEIQYFKEKGFKVSIALNPQTPLDAIISYLDIVDGVLVMTVEPGRHGGKFKPETLLKITELRNMGFFLPIEVDGSVNPETIKKIKAAGANVFACGSFLMDSKNVAEGIKSLKEAIRESD
jgi:ribulose-phosphate 3-epimerase